MKILIAVHHYPPRYQGGAELRAHRTARALQERGYQVNVICIERIDTGPKDGLSWSDEVYDGVPVRRLSFDLHLAPDRFHWEYDNPWIGDHLRSYIQELQPDVFHLVSGYLMTASALHAALDNNLPCVVSLTDLWFLCPRIHMLRSNGELSSLPIDPVNCARCLGEESRRYRLPAKIAPAMMDAFWRAQRARAEQIVQRSVVLLSALNKVQVAICPSQFLRSQYIQAGISPERLIYSRQGRDFPNITPRQVEKRPSSTLQVGYIGQIAENKGVHILLEAVKNLPEAKLVVKIYGDSSHFPLYTKRLKKMADKDERVQLIGRFEPENISQVLGELDLLVVPSLVYENSPNVILEALAHHLPVVGSRLGGIPELVIHNENGLLFRAGDSGDLAKQLHRLLDEPDLLLRFQRGIQPIRSTQSELDELVSIYLRLCHDRLGNKPEEMVKS